MIIHCGKRVAANGDVRLNRPRASGRPSPGVRAPYGRQGEGVRHCDALVPRLEQEQEGIQSDRLPRPRVQVFDNGAPGGDGIRIAVNLDLALPAEWADRVGFNLEL